jgi:NADPH2:quinone reductase
MKALLSKTPGGPDTLVLEEVPDPAPSPGQVRIAVHACGVNFPDALIIEDKYQLRPPRPFSPGGEVAGVVEALGEGVTHLKPGARVIAFTAFGGMAEKIVADAARCVPMPEGMPFEAAAAFVMTYATSHHALKDRAKLQAGETLLVLGAAGGVGLAAVELGKVMGARVVAAVSSQDKADLALAHGADSAVIYPHGPFDTDGRKALAKLFKDAVGDGGANVIYDPVGGDYSEASLRAIAWEGRFLVVGFPAGIAKLPLNLTLLKSCQVVGVFWGGFMAHDPKLGRQNIADLLSLYQQGRIKPEISGAFGLEQGGKAITELAERRALGKLVVTMDRS